MRAADIELSERAASLFAELQALVMADPAGRDAVSAARVRGSTAAVLQDKTIGAVQSLADGARAEIVLERLKSAWWALAMTASRVAIRETKRHAPPGTETDTLQEAYIGLYEAARRYQCNEVPFSHYAGFWVRARIGRFLFVTRCPVRRPNHHHNAYAIARKMAGVGRSMAEIEEAIGIDPRVVLGGDTSLNVASRPDDDCTSTMLDRLWAPSPNQDRIVDIERAIESLPDSLRPVVYGWLRCEALRETGERLGISQQRVELIELRAIQLLAERRYPEVMGHWPDTVGSLVVALAEGVTNPRTLKVRLGVTDGGLRQALGRAERLGAIRRTDVGRLVPA